MVQELYFDSRLERVTIVTSNLYNHFVHMNFLLWGITLGTIGKLILGIAVLRVHLLMLQEHKFDGIVFRGIKKEHVLTIVGLVFIVVGYLLEVMFYQGSTLFFDCTGSECVGAINAAFNL